MRILASQLTLHKLEVFCHVAELGSISKAAERCGIAQPVVTAHVKALSDKLGVSLTQRVGRRIALTDNGERVYRWANEIMIRTRELERELSDTHLGIMGKAAVAASMTLGSYVLPGMISSFRRLYPKGDISVRVTSPLLATEAVLIGDCDFAFTILDPRHDIGGLEVEQIVNEELILVASPTSGFNRDTAQPGTLRDIPFVTAQRNTPRREIEEHALMQFGIVRDNIVMEFGHAEAIKQAVRAGAGAAFLFRSSVHDELASGILCQIDTPGMVLNVPVYLVRRRGKQLVKFQTELIDFLVAALRAYSVAPDRKALFIDGA